MVLGYICNEHGYQSECGVSESGERTCQECEKAVTGLIGRTRDRTRSPPEGEAGHTEGSIKWIVDGYDVNLTVTGHDYIDAIEAAIEKVDEPQAISEVQPKVRRYRG